jgi:orotate phosphoribosyltransferase
MSVPGTADDTPTGGATSGGATSGGATSGGATSGGASSGGASSGGAHQEQADRDRLCAMIRELAVVHGRVTLASGRQADYYVDLRRITLHAAAAPLVGRVLLRLAAGWDFEAAGGLTMGADPVAAAMLHAAAGQGRALDAFAVRKEGKAHGLQRRIEGPDVAGRRVLAVEDTSTTGGSVLTAVEALRAAGADVVGVAVIVDRGTGAREAIEAAGLGYRAAFGLADLGLAAG